MESYREVSPNQHAVVFFLSSVVTELERRPVKYLGDEKEEVGMGAQTHLLINLVQMILGFVLDVGHVVGCDG